MVAGGLPELAVDTLVESIEKAKDYLEACAEVGKGIREQESGSKIMVELLENKVN